MNREQGTMRSEKIPLFFCVEKICEWLYKKKRASEPLVRDNLHSIRTLQILISAPNRWFDCCLLPISNKNVSFHYIVKCEF